jgi:hypothetical protein
MAITVEADGAHSGPTDAVERALIVAAMPAARVFEVARFPHQKLEKLAHLRLAQHYLWPAVDGDAHAPITALVLAGHNGELELIASHKIPPPVEKMVRKKLEAIIFSG